MYFQPKSRLKNPYAHRRELLSIPEAGTQIGEQERIQQEAPPLAMQTLRNATRSTAPGIAVTITAFGARLLHSHRSHSTPCTRFQDKNAVLT